jgi:hypothetical protein
MLASSWRNSMCKGNQVYRFLAIALTFALCACGNTVSSLHYVPTSSIEVASAPSIGAVTATDQRKEEPNRLATIMGGFGNPLKTLDTAKPVKDEVADAFLEGLRARGMLASNTQAPFRIALVVRKFDADMLVGRTGRIDLTMSVIDRGGNTVYEDAVTDSESETKFFETGIFADIADLQKLCEIVLNRTVNRLLDKPEFRTAVGRASVN